MRDNPRLRRFSVAAAILVLAAGPARAEPQPPPAQPVHKHIAGVKYEDFAKSGEVSTADAQVIAVESVSWDAGPVYSADPMEGGQVAGGAAPVARVAATVTALAGKLVKGKHLNQVTITTRSGSHTLHDAIVTSVTPAGDGMETVSLSYASKDD